MRAKVLIAQPMHESWKNVLGREFEVKVGTPDITEAALKNEVRDVAAIIVRNAVITREIIEAASALKVIGRHGVGVDNIDLAAASEKGIMVVNTPNANTVSVAEHTVTAIGALAKQVVMMHTATRAGDWEVRNEYRPVDLDGRILGVIGFGKIGSLVAQRAAAAFNMRIIATRSATARRRDYGYDLSFYDDPDEIFKEADVVSLHLPLTPKTKGFVNRERFSLMKPTAYLVNFARGAVVDEGALYNALKNRVIAGAAVDVFEQEPPDKNNPLFELDNILLSPHSAALTAECVCRMATDVARGVRDALNGKRPRYLVNPEIFRK